MNVGRSNWCSGIKFHTLKLLSRFNPILRSQSPSLPLFFLSCIATKLYLVYPFSGSNPKRKFCYVRNKIETYIAALKITGWFSTLFVSYREWATRWATGCTRMWGTGARPRWRSKTSATATPRPRWRPARRRTCKSWSKNIKIIKNQKLPSLHRFGQNFCLQCRWLIQIIWHCKWC